MRKIGGLYYSNTHNHVTRNARLMYIADESEALPLTLHTMLWTGETGFELEFIYSSSAQTTLMWIA